MNVQGALEAARFTKGTFDGCDLNIETRVPAAVIKELESMGHVIKGVGFYSGGMGGGQAVMSVAGGVHFGGSDPRKDGAAVPENPGLQDSVTASRGGPKACATGRPSGLRCCRNRRCPPRSRGRFS